MSKDHEPMNPSIAEQDQGFTTKKNSPWLLATGIATYLIYSAMTPPCEPSLQKLSLETMTKSQLQLIPSIGPILAQELKNLQGHDLQTCKGIGAFREQTLLRYLTTPAHNQP
jgi:DNA uptake protein ComE-like DNA-binding protein